MESDLGKLFVGGISWDTNEDRLKDYFSTYGEVVEAVIMKDRTTGRARGFGFIVFADPAVAEKVVMQKHIIDGRTVEAKKAVPRDDQQTLSRGNSSTHGSPGPARTKKIFVGGLASTVTESDFKTYFDQFGTITDVVVMYDHNTQRPRGFGFITYDSEDSVDKVLHKTFHELNGKMVEVKRAVPKVLSPGPSRSPLNNYNYGLNRINNFLNIYPQGFNPTSIGGFNLRMDGRFSPISSSRSGYPPFSPSGFGMGLNFDSGLNTALGAGANFGNNVGYGRSMNPYYAGNAGRYGNVIGLGGNSSPGTGSVLSSAGRNVWGNGGINYATNNAPSNAFMGSGSGNIGALSSNLTNWGSSSLSSPGRLGNAGFSTSNLGYGSGDSGFGGLAGAYGRSSGGGAALPSLPSSTAGLDGPYADIYSGSSVFGDPTWRSSASDLDEPGSFGYGLGATLSDVSTKSSTGFISPYSVANNQPTRGQLDLR